MLPPLADALPLKFVIWLDVAGTSLAIAWVQVGRRDRGQDRD